MLSHSNEPPRANPGLVEPAPEKSTTSDPARRAAPDSVRVSPRPFFSAMCSASVRQNLILVWIFFLQIPDAFLLSLAVGSCSAAGRRAGRSQRTPSASGTKRSAVAPARHTATRLLLVQQMPPQDGDFLFCGVVLSWSSSSVLSVILTVERPLHFQLRRT